jgi:Tfp pilus assembly protein PilX
MNPIIKAILIRRSREQGFAIPTIIALGLIMTLIGTINIFKSSDENLTAISQRDAQKALTAAEAGVAYYRDLIDKNKTIAVYNSTGTVSWTNPNNIPAINNNCGFTNQGNTAVSNAATSAWQNVNGNSDLGQYRLKSYTYDGNAGTLVIEGRDRNSTDAASIEVSVDFPIQPGLFPTDFPNNITNKVTENLNNLNPALWIANNDTPSTINTSDFNLNGSNDNLTVDGNILISKDDCDLSAIQTQVDALGNVTANSNSIPPIPTQPTSITTITNNSDIINTDLPRSGDLYQVENGENVFYYLIQNDLDLADTEKIQITTGSKVVFYLQGNMTITGNVDINCNDTDNDDVCDDTNDSDNLQIYVTNTTSTVEFKGSGTINVKALIHAPNAEATITSDELTVNINGAIWVNKWDSSTGDITITSDESYFYYKNLDDLVTQLGAINPIIYPPTNWQTCEVDSGC